VFCARLGRTLDLHTCTRCPAFLEVARDASEDGHVECLADGAGPTPSARPRELTCQDGAGALATASPPCVREDVGARSVARLLIDTGAPYVLVVDAGDRVVGAVWSTAALDPALEPGATAAEVMTTAQVASEVTTIHATLLRMAASHLRSMAIVADDGTPVGVLRDVDALRAWARRRRDGDGG
jgi:CBS-domain-containing membrane protein